MKEFMLMALGGNPDWMKNATPEEKAAAGQAMMAWMQKLKENNQLVSPGAPLGFQGKRIGKDGVVTDLSSVEMKEIVTGYMIIKAEDYEDAVKMAQESPMVQYHKCGLDIREVFPTGPKPA